MTTPSRWWPTRSRSRSARSGPRNSSRCTRCRSSPGSTGGRASSTRPRPAMPASWRSADASSAWRTRRRWTRCPTWPSQQIEREQWDEASAMLEEVIEVSTRLLGADHRRTLSSKGQPRSRSPQSGPARRGRGALPRRDRRADAHPGRGAPEDALLEEPPRVPPVQHRAVRGGRARAPADLRDASRAAGRRPSRHPECPR